MVLADQHNADWMGCAGHPQAITPHLDAFAADSCRFDSAYCANPICTPSRVSILSGQYCHNHGIYGLSGPAPLQLPSIFSHFRSQGYRTSAYGKLHLPCRPRNWIADHVDEFCDAYETVNGTLGRSGYLDYLEQLGLREYEDSWHNTWHYGSPPISFDACPSQLPYKNTLEQWCVDRFLSFIDQPTDQPFCAQISFQKPHHPLLPQQQFWDLYPEDIELPKTYFNLPAGRPPHFSDAWKRMKAMPWDFKQPSDSPHAGAQRAWRGTLACISQIDDVFGRLMRELSRRQLLNNTVVVYSSDHGGYHGVHGIVEKSPGICSNSICRIPLIIRAPGVTLPDSISSVLVESVDLAPTLTALAGLPPMVTSDGEDISGSLRGTGKPRRKIAVTENPWSKSVRWNQWRYVHYPERMFAGETFGELYDLSADPDETNNLFGSSKHQDIVHKVKSHLLDWLIETQRVTTSHPAVEKRTGIFGGRDEITLDYPVAGDGKAPNCFQPKNRHDNDINYL